MELTSGAFDSDYYDTIESMDHETVRMLKEYSAGNPEIIKDIFDSFMPESKELIEKLKYALENKNFEVLRNAAHAMAGICGSVGALRLRKISMDIERMIIAGKNLEALKIVRNIFPAYDEYIELIKNF